MLLFKKSVFSLYFVFLAPYYDSYGQSVITSDQSAREGDTEVVIPCDYSKFTDRPDTIGWKKVDEFGAIIDDGIVNERKMVSGRYKLKLMDDMRRADLVISDPVRADSQSRFQCRIRNLNGDTESSKSSILTVYYLDDPVLTGPTSIIYEGEPVMLTCTIPDGDPAPYVTWYKDGKPMTKNNVTTNDTMSVLHINKSLLDDVGNYTCNAESNEFKGNNIKNSATYQLIIRYLQVKFESQGNNATCTAEGYPKPSSIKIMRDGEVIKNGEDTATVKINDEICKSNITCYADNQELTQTEELKNCTVKDEYPVLIAPTSIIYKGDHVKLACSIPVGDPASDVTWYKDGNTLPSKYVVTNSTMSVLHIEATLKNQGNYTCKVKNDQFQDTNAEYSSTYILTVHYLEVKFKFQDNSATCTAAGHPMPSSITVMKDGKVIKNGENTATVTINDEICKSNITCYADNGELIQTEELMKSDCIVKGVSESRPYVIIIVVVIIIILWSILLCYFIYFKKIEWELSEDVQKVEGVDSVTMTWRYRPSVALFKTFDVNKDEIKYGSRQQQFSSYKLILKYILYCFTYFCGICCVEYCINRKQYARNEDGKRRDERGIEYQQLNTIQDHENPSSSSVKGVQENRQNTRRNESTNDKPQFCNKTNGRGSISVELHNPIEGEYSCYIVGRQNVPTSVNKLSVRAPRKHVFNTVVTTNVGTSIVKLDLCLLNGFNRWNTKNIKWYKETEPLKPEEQQYESATKFYRIIKNVTHEDAGEYRCEVVPEDDRKQTQIYSVQLKVEDQLLKCENVNVISGECAKIPFCVSTAKPIRGFFLKKENSDLPGKRKQVPQSPGSDQDSKKLKIPYTNGKNDGFLNIPKKVTEKDEGNYHCICETNEIILNDVVSYSTTFKLNVCKKSIKIAQPVYKDNTIVLTCNIVLAGVTHIIWLYKPKSIAEERRIYTYNVGDGGDETEGGFNVINEEIHPSGFLSHLEIPNHSQNHGCYTCEVKTVQHSKHALSDSKTIQE